MQATRFIITAATAIVVAGTFGFVYAQSSDAGTQSAMPVADAPATSTTTSDQTGVKDRSTPDAANDAPPAAAPLAAKADRN